MNRRILYPAGMLGIILICIFLAIIGAGLPVPPPQASEFGIALPSPDLWHLNSVAGEVLNVILLGVCGCTLYFINKQFSLIRTGQPLGAAFFLPLCFALLPVGGRWSATPVVTLLTLIIYAMLFSTYRSRNATKPLFVVATVLSVGSMFQYAFIPLGIAAFICAFMMESMSLKGFFAMGLGIIAPYWVGIGLGLIAPADLRLPMPHTIFEGGLSPELFILVIIVGILALCAAIISLYNGIILYAGNSRVRRSILVMNTFGITALIAMLLDVYNINSYIGVFFIWFSIQFANLFTLRELRRGSILFWLMQLAIDTSALIFVFAM